jgi:uncharacterized membrane protein YphA (DoxX/SURF4 family)
MFAYMAIMKLLDPIAFLKETREYGIIPTTSPLYLNLTAIAVPWLELVCAAALILGIWRRGAALLISGMLAFFTPLLLVRAIGYYTAPAAAYGNFCDVKFDCGCGTGEVYICWKIAENLLLTVGALIVLLSSHDRLSLGRLFGGRSARAPAPRVSNPAPA